MRIPKSVKVGGHIFGVKYPKVIDGGISAGELRYHEGILPLAQFVKFDQEKPPNIKAAKQSLEAVFIHEVVHAIDIIYNGHCLTEKEVKCLGEGLYQVIKDNPDIFRK